MGLSAIGRGRKVVPICLALALKRRHAVTRAGLVPSTEKVPVVMRRADGHAPMHGAKRATARPKVGRAIVGLKVEDVIRRATKA